MCLWWQDHKILGEMTIQSNCWENQRATELKSSLEDPFHFKGKTVLFLGDSLERTMLRPLSCLCDVGWLAFAMSLETLPQSPVSLSRGREIWGLPWALLDIIYCRITIQLGSICADRLWAITGQPESQPVKRDEEQLYRCGSVAIWPSFVPTGQGNHCLLL